MQKKIQYWTCGKRGHFRQECTNPPNLFLSICQKVAILTRDCSRKSRWRQEMPTALCKPDLWSILERIDPSLAYAFLDKRSSLFWTQVQQEHTWEKSSYDCPGKTGSVGNRSDEFCTLSRGQTNTVEGGLPSRVVRQSIRIYRSILLPTKSYDWSGDRHGYYGIPAVCNHKFFLKAHR